MDLPIRISARVQNSRAEHHVTLRTNDHAHAITIPPKPNGLGSSANGGELLCLALATCYCNDLYREAAKRHIDITHIEIEVTADFGADGAPARHLSYRTKVSARDASEADVRNLVEHTDRVAEVHNTLRAATAVTLASFEIEVS